MSVFDEIAANAAQLDANPAFPTDAMAALTKLETPDTRGEARALVRRVESRERWCRERESNPHGVATAGF